MRSLRHTAYILGSAQDGGLPQLGAYGPRDHHARGDARDHRLAASLAVVRDGDGRTLLVDASPDIKAQEARLLERSSTYAASRTNGAPPFDAVLLTHAHMGHYAGMLHLGREAANTSRVPCLVTPRLCQRLEPDLSSHSAADEIFLQGCLVQGFS